MAFQVEFVSPEQLLYSGQATQVVTRTRGGGEIAFLEGHEPFVGSLQTCIVRVAEAEGGEVSFAVRGGFVSVANEKVTVLSNEAKSVADIDIAAAAAELEAAELLLVENSENESAKLDKKWAETRLRVADAKPA